MAIEEITNPDTFRAALKEHKVVVADFHALWCGDCKMIDPFFKKYVWTLQSAPRAYASPRVSFSAPRCFHYPAIICHGVPPFQKTKNKTVDTVFISARHAADEKFKDVYFCKIDVDVLQDLSKELSIRRMPTFILFKDGNRVEDIFEPNPPQLDAFLAKAL
ncbi:thioredoxin [Akanthomyces lecanii RCEF 1005]|uniref:Thioredoxin n=1 Tax=Akanthomyces lecanii RCEF 1005 TaxID=1081108 RepID=A0A162LI83_CORDF|nr:thioredoxin [Akanthomyces lecanii RCEF 1005]